MTVFLATPLGKNGNIHVKTSVFCSIVSRSPEVEWGHICQMGVELSRNNLIEDHLHFGRDWSFVFLLDSDVVPPLFALKKMLGYDADFVTGFCPIIMKEGLYWNVAGEDGNLIPYHEKLPDEPFEVPSCGAGCILVKKKVIDSMDWPYFKMCYQPKWENGGDSMKKGEDIYFSEKAVSLGYKILADPSIRCEHYNQVELSNLYKVIKNQVETGNVRKEKA